MNTFLVIAFIDGAQVIRLFLGWSVPDVERQVRYYWRNNTISSLEIHAHMTITVPDEFEI